MVFAKLNSMKFVGLDGLSHFWSKAKAYTDTQVGTETACRKASDTLCTSCAYKCASTVGGSSCAYAVSCAHSIGTSCKNSACNSAIAMDALCLACSYACGKSVCTSAISRENTCLSCAYACVDKVCCNTITRDTLCLACSYACTNTKASSACTYANTVAGQCKVAACTYAHCAINACKGIGVMGVARSKDGQQWTKSGYWAYMTTLDGPNCCWNHVIKMDWGGAVDPWATGISLPTYNAPNNGIYYKYGCCAGHSGWTLVPDISCVQKLSGSCASSIGTSCKNAACAFAAACAASVVPETSTFAKCYGKSTSCVECANKVRLNAFSSNVYYKIPFTSTTGATSTSGCLVVGTYPSYNPNSQVSCVYTECVAKTLAVPNGNGCLRLGSYCIYIG